MPAPEDLQYVRDLIYALENTNNNDTIGGVSHQKVRNYGLQPDGDLVGHKETGEVFSTSDNLAANETFTSDWFDSDGWSSIEVLVRSDTPSAFNGVHIEFTDDVQATTPTVDSLKKADFEQRDVERGFRYYRETASLDGFRVVYENGDTATSSFKIVASARNQEALDAANYVTENALGNPTINVSSDPNAEGLTIGEPSSLFGDIATVSRDTVLDISSSFGISTLRDEVTTTGSATVPEAPNTQTGEITISTGTTPDSTAQIQTAQYGRYTPGYSAQVGLGIRLPNPPTEGEARWGYFSDQNGYYWGYDGSAQELFIARRKGGTEVNRIYRSDWNRSSVEDIIERPFDVTNGNIYQIDYSWYGYGIVLFSVVVKTRDTVLTENPRQETVPVHAIAVDAESSTADPNQPIRVETENGASGEDYNVYLGGRQYSVFGAQSSERRVTAQNRSGVSVDDTAWTYIMGWRRANGTVLPNSRINVQGFSTIQTGDTKYAFVLDPNVSGETYTAPELVDPDETLVEVSTTGSFDGIGGGTKVYEGLSAGGRGQKSVSTLQETDVRFGQNQTLVLLARGVDSSSTVDATMRIQEDW